MQYAPRRCLTSRSAFSKTRRGANAVFEALLQGTLSVALATAAGEWCVNINAPDCSLGTGPVCSPRGRSKREES